jgi:hypothetical protein
MFINTSSIMFLISQLCIRCYSLASLSEGRVYPIAKYLRFDENFALSREVCDENHDGNRTWRGQIGV